MKAKFVATAMLFTTAIIWGFAFVAQVLGGDHIPPFTFNGIRFLLGAVSLIPVYLIFEKEHELSPPLRRQRHKHTCMAALCCGGFLFISSALQQYGTSLTRDPGKAGFITGLYTILTPIFYFLIFRKKSGLNVWLGCVLATVGLYLLCRKEGEAFSLGKGEWMLLIGSLFWAGHILAVDRFIDRVSPLRFSSWQFCVTGLLAFVAGRFVSEEVTLTNLWDARWAIFFCGILSVGIAYTFQVLGQRRSDPTYAAIIFSTESIFAAVGGLLWNQIAPLEKQVDQNITPLGYVGCLIIFAGIVLSQLSFPKRKRLSKSLDTPQSTQTT